MTVPELDVDPELVAGILEDFISQEVLKVGASGVVIGLSGGVDSGLAAWLAVRALGRSRVSAVSMPYGSAGASGLADALATAGQLGIECQVIDIAAQIDCYFQSRPDAGNLRRGNKMARERMSILFDLSQELGALVLGTSNKSELLLGYGTLFGDMAHALNPLGDLYKVQVYQLARFAQLPSHVLEKPPSAELFDGQSDEQDLGYSYDQADPIMFQLVDERRSPPEVGGGEGSRELAEVIWSRIRRNQFKRRPPLIAKLSSRTINLDFRYPRDWGS